MASIRERQATALRRMLNFNAPVTKTSSAEPTWKILVYDRLGQDIISPLLSVKDLRDMGVTLHLLIHSDRESIPDVPAIYFVMPTDENVQRINRDLQNNLYDSYYFNFISPISRQKLEDIAASAIHCNAVTSISRIYDQYVNFISLEEDMFILRHQKSEQLSYHEINKADVKDTEIEMTMDLIVDSLFSSFVTLGAVPIIRCPRGNAAEMVAVKLDKKLRDNIRDARNSLFNHDNIQAGQFSFQRPLLVILDRNLDLATPFHHTWTYQALCHDVLDLKLNRVEIEDAGEASGHAGARPKKKKKLYDLNPTDRFWQTQKGSPFPQVAECVQEELESYRSQEDEVKRLKTAMGLEGMDEDVSGILSENTAKLTSAVSSLPELLEKKRLIDMHTNIATSLLEHIKARKLDIYFETEEKLMSKSIPDRSLMDIITDPDAGKPEDKVRLFIIALICGPQMSDVEVDQYLAALESAGCDLAPIKYVRRWKQYSKVQIAPSAYGGGGTKTISMFSKLMSHGSSFVMEGVKNLVVKKHNLPVTRIVDALMELKSYQDVDDYRYFDPKLLRVTDEASIPRNRSPFQEAYVFMVGGGNYIEYQNLVDYAKGKGPNMKKITYGCTELLNAAQFLRQLTLLGNEM